MVCPVMMCPVRTGFHERRRNENKFSHNCSIYCGIIHPSGQPEGKQPGARCLKSSRFASSHIHGPTNSLSSSWKSSLAAPCMYHIFCPQLSPQMLIPFRWLVTILMRAVSHWQYYFKTKPNVCRCQKHILRTWAQKKKKTNWGQQKHLFSKNKTWNSTEVPTRGRKTVDLSSSRRGEYAPTHPPPATVHRKQTHVGEREKPTAQAAD